LGAYGWNQAVAKQGEAAVAERLSENDQPVLDRFPVQVDDAVFEHATQVYAEWLAQRSRRFFQDLPDDDQASVCGLLAHPILVDLLATPVTYPLVRRSQRFQIEGQAD